MAKMHSRARGSSGSKRPLNPTKPTWTRTTSKEIEMIISKFAKEGRSSSEIGMILRDSYGVPNVHMLVGKTITEILEDKKLSPKLPEDLLQLMRRAVSIRKHLERNKHDTSADRGLLYTESKIKRLAKYYKRAGKLPADWKYSPKDVKIYVQ